jgi:adenosine deaminase
MQTTLNDEYLMVAQRMAASPAQLKEIALNGIRASWLDASAKRALLVEWRHEIDGLLAEMVPA